MYVLGLTYQQDIVTETINSNKHTLIQVPTGGGKTVISRFIAFDLAYKQDKQVLFVAPKLVLMEQTLKAFKDINPQKIHGTEYYNPKHKVLVSTLQTASRREELQPDVIIIDEIHHGYDGSMIEKLIKDKPHTRVIGLSATPYDRKGKLLKGFELILDKYDMNYMIEHNFLVGLKPYVLVRQDLSEVKITAGDYNLGELSQVVCNKNTILEIIETTKKFILESKKTIVFAVDITHAELLTKAYVEKGFNAKALHSKIKKDEVKKEIELFREGKTQVLVSVLMLTTGFDVPDTDCAVIARPTKSQNLYKQMVGRVLRIAPDKTSAILLDCGNVIDNLGMPLEPIHEINRNDTKNNNKQKCRSCGTEDIKLIKKDNKLYWECQNKKCLFLKEVKQGTYECENCHLIYSHTSNYIFENDKIILNCECGFQTVVSEYKKQEVFVEVDKVLEDDFLDNKEQYFDINYLEKKIEVKSTSTDLSKPFEKIKSSNPFFKHLKYLNRKEIVDKREFLLLKSNLKSIPSEIEVFENLEKLNISSNSIVEISEKIVNLTKLKTLSFTRNKLIELPIEITKLINLEELDLSYNKLEKLPNEIVNLKKLKTLYLVYNAKNLTLTERQKEWLIELKKNSCKVYLNSKLSKEVISKEYCMIWDQQEEVNIQSKVEKEKPEPEPLLNKFLKWFR